MSLITACPSCDTRFIVKPEQLNAQNGKVRCGNCQHVFNAVNHLVEPDVTNQSASLENVETSEPFESEVESLAVTSNEQSLSIENVSSPSPDSPSVNQETTLDSQSIDKPLQTERATPTEVTVASNDVLLDIDPVEIKNPTREFDEKFFIPKTKPQHWSWGVFVVLLALMAIGQSIYFKRQAISIQWPATKQFLTEMCERIGCTINLPTNADLLTIDDSDLKEDASVDGLIHLNSTLINNARYTQAYPDLELTLTDANDLPVLRRTFKPNEYLPASITFDQGIAAAQEIHIHLALTASGEPVTGYRVFLTYDQTHENN